MISLIIWPPYLRLPPLPLLHGKVQMQIMACVVYEAFLNLGIFPKSLSDCGNACHTAVKAKDYIFHPYEMR